MTLNTDPEDVGVYPEDGTLRTGWGGDLAMEGGGTLAMMEDPGHDGGPGHDESPWP